MKIYEKEVEVLLEFDGKPSIVRDPDSKRIYTDKNGVFHPIEKVLPHSDAVRLTDYYNNRYP